MLEVMRDIFQSRYLRSNVAHKQLPRMSLSAAFNTIDHQILLNVLENDFGILLLQPWTGSHLICPIESNEFSSKINLLVIFN